MSSHDGAGATSVLRFVEHDAAGAPTGRCTTFGNVEFQPLSYSDLVDKKLGDQVVIPLKWSNAHVVESSIPELCVDGRAAVSTTLESKYSAKAIGLVRGGWLPSGLALQTDMVVMPDRCTITELVVRFRAGKKRREGCEDFVDLFQGKSVRINPALYALEGNQRRRPSPQHVAEQWAEACEKIRAALPRAELTPESAISGIIGLLNDMHQSMVSKERFLLRVVPELQSPVSARRRAAVWSRVLEIARDCGLSKHSLVVLAALSVVCVSNGSGPAKRLLKPSSNYTAEDAYNALADLRALEMLINLYAAFPQEKIMLCTQDKNLALFWSGLRAAGFVWRDGHTTYTISPVEALLPNVDSELLGLYLQG